MKTYPVYSEKHHLGALKNTLSKTFGEPISLNVQILYDDLGIDILVYKNSSPFFVFSISKDWDVIRDIFPACDATKSTQKKWLDAVRKAVVTLKEDVHRTNATRPMYLLLRNEDYSVY